MSYTLRPQQIVFEDAIRDAFRRVRTVLAVAPTGFGALTARKKYGSMVALLRLGVHRTKPRYGPARLHCQVSRAGRDGRELWRLGK